MVVLGLRRVRHAANVVGITPWADHAANQHRRVGAGIFPREIPIELDAANVDLLKGLAGKPDEFAPVTACAVVQTLVNHAKAVCNGGLNDLAMIVLETG